MNRKMTFFAFGVKCGCRGANGLAVIVGVVGSAAKKPSCDKRAVSATPVKPAPASQRNSRRVRRQKVFVGFESMRLIVNSNSLRRRFEERSSTRGQFIPIS